MAGDIDYLMFALNSTKPAEKKKAILEIEKSGSTEAGKNLIPLLERDRDDSMKALAARAVGALGVKSAGEALIGAIRSGSEEISYFAAISLSQISSDALVARIADEMKNAPENNDRSFFWFTEALMRSGNAAISCLVELLSIHSWSKRRILGDALISFGSEAEKYLVNAIADENADKRFWCAKILGRVGGSDAVNALIKFVDDDDRDVRSAVITALGEIGNKTAIEFLKKTLKSPKKELRHKSVEVLGKFGEEIVESLIESLSDDYWYVRDSACQALSKLGKKVIPYLAGAYNTGNEDIRISAIKALSTLGEDATDVLIHALGDRYEPICRKAAEAIVKIGPFSVDALMAAYKKNSSTDSIKRWIIYSLGEICEGSGNAAAAALIIEALRSNDLVIRHTAASALKHFRTPRVITVLIGLLADIHEEVRERAAENLALMAGESVPFLIEALSHESWVMRKNVAAVLGRIGDKSTPELLKVLQGGDEDARYWAIKAMGQIGSGAVEPLLQYLNDKSWQVRKNASDALAEIGEPVIKPLTAKLTRSNEKYGSNLFYWSEFILTKIGHAAHYPLMSLLNNANENVRIISVAVIGRTSTSLETYQLLKDMLLEDDSFDVRKKVVQVIGRFAHPDVIDLLTEFYDKNENIEENLAPLVIDAISKIESKKTMDFLQKMLKSSKWISRYRAICALMDLSEKSYLDLDIEKVVALLNDEVAMVAEGAAKFLASMKTEKAQISVVRLLKEKRFEDTILEALSKNSHFKSKDIIIPYLKAGDKNLRALAALALGMTGNKANISNITPLLSDEFITVRNAAILAISNINNRCTDEKAAAEKQNPQNSRKADPNAIEEPIITEAEQFYQLGLFHTKNGDFEKAIHAYQNTIAADAGFVMAYCKVGLILQEKGYYEKAGAFFRKALEISPDFILARLYLGMTYAMMNKTYEAVTELKAVLKQEPHSESAKMAQKILEQIKKNIA